MLGISLLLYGRLGKMFHLRLTIYLHHHILVRGLRMIIIVIVLEVKSIGLVSLDLSMMEELSILPFRNFKSGLPFNHIRALRVSIKVDSWLVAGVPHWGDLRLNKRLGFYLVHLLDLPLLLYDHFSYVLQTLLVHVYRRLLIVILRP